MGDQNALGGGAGAPVPLIVDVVVEGDEVRVVVEGGLDATSRLALHEAVWGATGAAGRDDDLVIDLRGVTHADVAGVQGLVELWRIGVVDRFVHVSDAVQAVVGKDPGSPLGG